MENKKQQLLNLVQMYGFYLCELNLYLDTHPECPNGLEAFAKYKQLYARAKEAYESCYGPLTADSSECRGVFEWAKGPWPWEREAN